MMAVDTSVVIAAFASWHGAHVRARHALEGRPALISHCAFETYSVLTRLPEKQRATPESVVSLLDRYFPDPPLTLPAAAQRDLVTRMAGFGIFGGATYDGLVGATAMHHGATLISLDTRARSTYDRLGVRVLMLAQD